MGGGAEMNGPTQCISAKCSECQKTKVLEVPSEGLAAYQNGAFIQRALPMLSAGDRELLISGICGPCFDKLFEEVEEQYADQ
jgi:hypothetical protein